jgi:hypothetical protein
MTKEEYDFLTPLQKEIIKKRWKYWWKRIQPKNGFTTLELEQAQMKFIRAQPKP